MRDAAVGRGLPGGVPSPGSARGDGDTVKSIDQRGALCGGAAQQQQQPGPGLCPVPAPPQPSPTPTGTGPRDPTAPSRVWQRRFLRDARPSAALRGRGPPPSHPSLYTVQR